MKKLFLLSAVLVQAVLAKAQIIVLNPADYAPGVPVDTVQYVVGYDMAYVPDASKHPLKPLHEQMTLDIGTHTAAFYSYPMAVSDSLAAENYRRGIKNFNVSGKITWRTYIDYPSAGRYQHLDRFGLDRFKMTSERPETEWTLTPDSTMTILGYTCRRATATILGRKWAVWYAEDIPLDRGPWLLSGLPGLILRAESADSCYRFVADGIEKPRTVKPLYYKGGKYEEVSRKSLAGVYRRYYADPVGYITNNPNVTVKVVDERGNRRKAPAGVKFNLPDGEMKMINE